MKNGEIFLKENEDENSNKNKNQNIYHFFYCESKIYEQSEVLDYIRNALYALGQKSDICLKKEMVKFLKGKQLAENLKDSNENATQSFPIESFKIAKDKEKITIKLCIPYKVSGITSEVKFTPDGYLFKIKGKKELKLEEGTKLISNLNEGDFYFEAEEPFEYLLETEKPVFECKPNFYSITYSFLKDNKFDLIN